MKSRVLFCALIWSAASGAAWAGAGSSGGGAAIVCRDGQGGIERAELLDLFEARERYGLRVMGPSGQMEQDYIRAVKNTYHLQGADDILVGSETRENLARFFKVAEFTMPGKHLPLLTDLGQTLSPPSGCAIEQLAIFYDPAVAGGKQRVEIDSEIWVSLDSLNQAALVTHELFYMFERELLEKTSEGTRAGVATIYAESGTTPVLEGLPARKVSCFSSDERFPEVTESEYKPNKLSNFYVYGHLGPNSTPEITLQFTQLMGRPILSKATVSLSGVNWLLRRTHGFKLVVVEDIPPVKFRVPLEGSQRRDWELEIEYAYQKQVKIGLYQKGVLIEEAFVDSCQ